MKKILLLLLLWSFIISCSADVVEDYSDLIGETVTVSSPSGDRTMDEIVDDWNTNGWPDSVGFAYRGGFNYEGFIMEYWNVGIVKGHESYISELTKEVSVPVEFTFCEVDFSYQELLDLFPEIEEKYSDNIDCAFVKLGNQNYIRLIVSDISYLKYQNDVEQYNGKVVVEKKSNVAFLGGNPDLLDYYKYEIIVLSVGAVLIIASSIIVMLVIKNVKKKREL